MGDTVIECAVKRKTSMKNLALLGLIIGLMVVAFAFFIFYLRNWIMFLIGILLCVLISKIVSMCDEEYEYIFVNGDMDFAKIVGKKKRVELMSVDMNEVELVAPLSSDKLAPYTKGDTARYAVRDYSSALPGHEERMYVLICKSENQAYRIIFEPSEKLIEAMWQLAPRIVEKKKGETKVWEK